MVLLRSVVRLLINANVVPSLSSIITLLMETIHSFETSVLTTATRLTSQNTSLLFCFRYIVHFMVNMLWSLEVRLFRQYRKELHRLQMLMFRLNRCSFSLDEPWIRCIYPSRYWRSLTRYATCTLYIRVEFEAECDHGEGLCPSMLQLHALPVELIVGASTLTPLERLSRLVTGL
jgi:hypothetical protein